MNIYERGNDPPPPMLLSIKQAAQSLSLSERTIWTLVQTGDLPHLRVGRRLLFSRTALEAWIERQQTNSDPNSGRLG